jgi:phospholipase/lecithinase/hemolysin
MRGSARLFPPLLLPAVRQSVRVQALGRWTVFLLLFALGEFSTPATFNSLYAFGDGVCTTTGNTGGGSLYYSNSYCNGRAWIQVLAQRQGLPYITSNNMSYFGQYSANLVAAVTDFTAPTKASNALFIVWICDADLVYDMENINPLTSLSLWTNALNQSLTNQLTAVQVLYNKGVRTLIMPNAVDITEIPLFNQTAPSTRSFIRARIIDFNAAFNSALNNLAATNAGLKIYVPNVFSLLDNILTNAASYGLTNVLQSGQSIDVLSDNSQTDYSLNGSGAKFIFWDPTDPTAHAHEAIADYVQQLISPAQIARVIPLGNSNRLDVVNFPAGLNGFVDGTTNITLTNWQSLQSFTNNSTAFSIFLPMSGSQHQYRLRFHYAWYWP